MDFEIQKPRLKISVRHLVAYTLRSGDLDLTTFGSPSSSSAIRLHQTIQDSRPKEYEREVPVHYEYETEDYVLEISGRIDGVYRYPDEVIIDEIKTTNKDLDQLIDSENVLHWGQVKCYAFLYAQSHHLLTIATQLTYFNHQNRQMKELRHAFDVFTLEEFFNKIANQYLEWIDKVYKWIELRNITIRELTFPYDNMRAGQEEIIKGVKSAIEKSHQLLIQAPTGIGKSMAVIYPSIKAIPVKKIKKIFYLTARTTGRTAAEDAIDLLREKGLKLKSVHLTAKKKICFNPEKMCDGTECTYARKFYDRINTAINDAFQWDSLSLEVIESISLEHQVCPFELSLEIAQWVDFVICDYNYVFDPRVYLRRFFQDSPNEYVFLVDEAHNLVDRSREMYSSVLEEESINRLLDLLEGNLSKLCHRLKKVKNWMVDFRKEKGNKPTPFADQDPPGVYRILKDFSSQTEKWLSLNEKADFRQDLVEFYFEVQNFIQTLERYTDRYKTCYQWRNESLSVKLFCVDPSTHLKESLEQSKATVFFSGTLSPMHYFIKSFGCDDDAQILLLPAPFHKHHFCAIIHANISTLYKEREMTKVQVAKSIYDFVLQKPGNYLVYYPSYQYMMKIFDIFRSIDAVISTVVQSPRMSEYEKEAFVKRFNQDISDPVIGFAVLGGVFSESIDLMGDRLTGAVIVGPGLPKVSLEREVIKDYFDRASGNGFAFSYQIPGMIKTIQAAGRVIRSENDRGVVLLIGSRFRKNSYRSLLPDDWNIAQVDHPGEMIDTLRKFWGRKIMAV
jgi:DNA excision repair protein ERCC-2